MSQLDALVSEIDRFPTLPDIAVQVSRKLEDVDCDLEEVALMIGHDAALAGRIMKMANSPIFGPMGECNSVAVAIQRLGFNESRSAVMTVALMDVMPQLPPPFTIRQFWTLNLASALTARRLAEDLHYTDPEEAYLAALVHGMGEAYLAITYPDRFEKAAQAWGENGGTLADAIEAEFGCGHPAVCGAMLRHWNFPGKLVRAVEAHLNPAAAAPEDSLLADVVLASDRLCRDLGLGPANPAEDPTTWTTQVSPAFASRLSEHGYPDLSFYLIELQADLEVIRSYANSVFPANRG